MDQPGSQASPSTKVERRVIEKNRRNWMKILYSQLNSLLPSYNPKEALPLPDQIDEAINYIKSLEEKVKMAKERKESLLSRRTSHASSSSSAFETKGKSLISPQIEIHEVGSSLEIVLISGLDNQFVFYEIIRILQEESIEVVSANSSLSGGSMLHVVHAQIGQSLLQIRATKISERLKRFVYGSTSDVEIQPGLWDFEIGIDTRDF